MKAEINDKNKARFFAQYWGQKVFINPILSHRPVFNKYLFDQEDPEDIDDEFLELTPLSAISDEDAVEVAKMIYANTKEGRRFHTPEAGREIIESSIRLGGHFRYSEGQFKYHVADYLRSRGYALPWMGLSVDELIAAGWVKLREV